MTFNFDTMQCPKCKASLPVHIYERQVDYLPCSGEANKIPCDAHEKDYIFIGFTKRGPDDI